MLILTISSALAIGDTKLSTQLTEHHQLNSSHSKCSDQITVTYHIPTLPDQPSEMAKKCRGPNAKVAIYLKHWKPHGFSIYHQGQH